MKHLYTIILSFSAFITLAGGWVQPKNNGYFQLSQRLLVADQIFKDWSETVDFRTLSNYTTSFYGEYGLNDKFTLVTDVPLFVRNTLNAEVNGNTGETINEGISFNSFGDIDLALKYGLKTEGSLVMNVGLFLGLPTGSTNSSSNIPLPTGDGEFNQMVKIEAGYGFNSPVYLVGGLGYNNRTKGFSDDVRYDLELGFANKFLFRIKVSGIKSTFNGDDSFSSTALFSNNVEHMTYNPEIGYIHDDKYGASLGIAGGNGRNVHAAPYFTFSLFMKVK